jgi:hypothetical protein
VKERVCVVVSVARNGNRSVRTNNVEVGAVGTLQCVSRPPTHTVCVREGFNGPSGPFAGNGCHGSTWLEIGEAMIRGGRREN